MSSVPRRHHYLPRWYLLGFTPSLKTSDNLWVTDISNGHQVRTVPANAAVETDLYKMDFSSDPGAVEKATALVDDRASAVVRLIHENQCVPVGEDLDSLLVFVTLMFLRTPAIRDRLWGGPATTELVKAVRDGLEEGAQIPDQARTLLQEIKDAGRFDEYRQVLGDDRFAAQIIPRAGQIVTMVQATGRLASSISEHMWGLWVSDGEIDFVCSDFPAWLFPLDVLRPKTEARKPGFANSMVGLPLSRKIALIGSPGRAPAVSRVGATEAAWCNLMTCMLASRYVYSPTMEVRWLNGGRLSGVDELVGFLAEREKALGGLAGWQSQWKHLDLHREITSTGERP